jgi:hypothetical protein
MVVLPSFQTVSHRCFILDLEHNQERVTCPTDPAFLNIDYLTRLPLGSPLHSYINLVVPEKRDSITLSRVQLLQIPPFGEVISNQPNRTLEQVIPQSIIEMECTLASFAMIRSRSFLTPPFHHRMLVSVETSTAGVTSTLSSGKGVSK